MMHRNVAAVLIVLALALTPALLARVVAQAPAVVPAGRFYGVVGINGLPAPSGATVTAQSFSGTACGSGTVTSGSYVLDIQAYGDCAGPLTFYVNGQRSNETAALPSLLSAAAMLNLSVSGLPPLPPFGSPLVYQTGWNLIGGPSGTVISGAAGPLYTYQPGDSSYQVLTAGSTLQAGAGYWARFTTPTSQTLGFGNRTSIIRSIPPGQFALIGNPFTTSAIVSGANAVYTYDPYRGYQPATLLQPGQGAWVLSSGSPVSISPALP